MDAPPQRQGEPLTLEDVDAKSLNVGEDLRQAAGPDLVIARHIDAGPPLCCLRQELKGGRGGHLVIQNVPRQEHRVGGLPGQGIQQPLLPLTVAAAVEVGDQRQAHGCLQRRVHLIAPDCQANIQRRDENGGRHKAGRRQKTFVPPLHSRPCSFSRDCLMSQSFWERST